MSKGGARKNAGRPCLSEDEKHERAIERACARQAIVIEELLFPALATAFNADPGPFKEHYLTIELSKREIELAYGRDGLSAWKSFFALKKIGGRDRFGHGYKSRWEVKLGRYAVICRFLAGLGYTIKDLEPVEFPPAAMRTRLEIIATRRASKVSARGSIASGTVDAQTACVPSIDPVRGKGRSSILRFLF